MKFTNGYWLNKEGVSNADAVQIREVKVEDNRVYLYVVPFAADSRAMGGPVMEMFISSPQPDIIRLQAYHFMGSNQKEPQFDLDIADCKLDFGATIFRALKEQQATMCTNVGLHLVCFQLTRDYMALTHIAYRGYLVRSRLM